MKRWLLGNLGVLLAALLILVASPVPAQAATTASVVVNATPAYVSITNTPSTYSFNTGTAVAVSTNYSSANNYFNITNASTVNIDVAISCNATWLGGTPWTHSDAGTPGADTAAMSATPGTEAWNIVVKNSSPNDLYNNTGTATLSWGLRLATPTSYSDGVLKTNTVTLTATAH